MFRDIITKIINNKKTIFILILLIFLMILICYSIYLHIQIDILIDEMNITKNKNLNAIKDLNAILDSHPGLMKKDNKIYLFENSWDTVRENKASIFVFGVIMLTVVGVIYVVTKS